MSTETTNRLNKGLGWIPDVPDFRDKKFNLLNLGPAGEKVVSAVLPSAVDLRPQCPAIEDQGELGSCTAQALVGCLEFLEMKRGETFTDYSRLFLYYNERVYIHTELEDSGAIIRDGIKTLRRRGICTEEEWPYNVDMFMSKPTQDCYTNAKQHKTVLYQRLNTLEQMRACLTAGYPFVFGFAVYDSFISPAVEENGDVPMPRETENMLGGHAVMVVGFDDGRNRFICRNSWGTEWGDKGYFYMPYAYLEDRNLSEDFWCIFI
jgi:C1A family cysteine protease